MKAPYYFVLLLLFFSLRYVANSQNVGIGTSTPGARLDLTRPGGDTPTLNIRGSAVISHFNFGLNEDTYLRGGKSTSNLILNDLGSRRVGLGMSNPAFPLSFPAFLGDKISLYGDSGPHYGFGVQPYLMQIHTDGPSSDIAFGHGSSDSFTETFRIKGNGALKLNGSEGSAGQALTSTGNGVEWRSPTKTAYDLTTMLTQTQTITLPAPSSSSTEIPGLTHTFNTSVPTKILLFLTLDFFSPACASCDRSTIFIDISHNNNSISTTMFQVLNGQQTFVPVNFLISANPGSHTIKINVGHSGPTVQLYSGSYNKMILQMIPN